jgi:hypothetical protein
MYLFALSLFYIVVSVVSVEIKPKFCINCRYYIPNTDGLKPEYGKCSAFPFENSKFMVDGKIRETEFFGCSTARSFEKFCGKAAIKYKKKYVRKQKITE